MMKAEFVIDGEVVSKARPRFNSKTHHAHTPQKTVAWENWVRLSYKQQCKEYFGDKPLRVGIVTYFSIPKSFSKKKERMALNDEIQPTKKPDCDNIAKSILDSLNGIAYDDDKNIVMLEVTKMYGSVPHTDVTIEEIVND